MNLVNQQGVLAEEFYLLPTNDVAKQLLGKQLFRQTADGLMSGIIVETEAYLFDDPASHAFRGKTTRNDSMFGPPGRTYVYLSYGVHDMLNIVTGKEGVGEAVLLRAVCPVDGIELIRRHSQKPNTPNHWLAAGPGLLAKAFAINRKTDNNCDVTTKSSGVWIEAIDNAAPINVISKPRIGITRAAEKEWRYYIAGSSSVSKP
jgi:DNA-3-methyladenine glycosylase